MCRTRQGLSFNEAEAITPRIRGPTISSSSCLGGFNEAEAITPRIPLKDGEADTGRRTSFNEAEAITPRIRYRDRHVGKK